jgi:hypothetical protein
MKIFKALKLLLKYRAASKKVQEIEAILAVLFNDKEFEKRLPIISQWSNACVKRNKLEKQLLKAFLDI